MVSSTIHTTTCVNSVSGGWRWSAGSRSYYHCGEKHLMTQHPSGLPQPSDRRAARYLSIIAATYLFTSGGRALSSRVLDSFVKEVLDPSLQGVRHLSMNRDSKPFHLMSPNLDRLSPHVRLNLAKIRQLNVDEPYALLTKKQRRYYVYCGPPMAVN